MAVTASFGAAPFVLVVIPLLVQHLNEVLPSIDIFLVILLVVANDMTSRTMSLLSHLARRWFYPTE